MQSDSNPPSASQQRCHALLCAQASRPQPHPASQAAAVSKLLKLRNPRYSPSAHSMQDAKPQRDASQRSSTALPMLRTQASGLLLTLASASANRQYGSPHIQPANVHNARYPRTHSSAIPLHTMLVSHRSQHTHVSCKSKISKTHVTAPPRSIGASLPSDQASNRGE